MAGSTFFSLPDGLRHLFRDHNPYSMLHIPYSMLYVIYDLEGSNAVLVLVLHNCVVTVSSTGAKNQFQGDDNVNPQVRNLFHVGKIYLPFCLVH